MLSDAKKHGKNNPQYDAYFRIKKRVPAVYSNASPTENKSGKIKKYNCRTTD